MARHISLANSFAQSTKEPARAKRLGLKGIMILTMLFIAAIGIFLMISAWLPFPAPQGGFIDLQGRRF